MKRLLVACAVAVAAVPAGTAFAGDGGTKGPGSCGIAPGSNISEHAQDPGPNAGPNGTTTWFVAPDTPNSPGQAVKYVCIEGN